MTLTGGGGSLGGLAFFTGVGAPALPVSFFRGRPFGFPVAVTGPIDDTCVDSELDRECEPGEDATREAEDDSRSFDGIFDCEFGGAKEACAGREYV